MLVWALFLYVLLCCELFIFAEQCEPCCAASPIVLCCLVFGGVLLSCVVLVVLYCAWCGVVFCVVPCYAVPSLAVLAAVCVGTVRCCVSFGRVVQRCAVMSTTL